MSNTFVVTGHIGRAATTKQVNGTYVTNFSLANNTRRNGIDTVQWYQVALWNQYGVALAPHLIPGQLVQITGDLSLKQYTDRGGATQISADINGQNCLLLGGKPAPKQAQATEDEMTTPVGFDPDNISM